MSRMTFNQLANQIAAISDRDFLLYQSGVPGFFHLGENGKITLLLQGASASEILDYIKKN
jgi:hypothetical protein